MRVARLRSRQAPRGYPDRARRGRAPRPPARPPPEPPGGRADRAAYRGAASPGRGTRTRRSCAQRVGRAVSPRVVDKLRSVRSAQQYSTAAGVLAQHYGPGGRVELRVDAHRKPGEIGHKLPRLGEEPRLRCSDDDVEVAGGARNGDPSGQLKADAAGRAPGKTKEGEKFVDRLQDA